MKEAEGKIGEKGYGNLLSMTDERSIKIETQQSHGEKCIRRGFNSATKFDS